MPSAVASQIASERTGCMKSRERSGLRRSAAIEHFRSQADYNVSTIQLLATVLQTLTPPNNVFKLTDKALKYLEIDPDSLLPSCPLLDSYICLSTLHKEILTDNKWAH